MSLNPVAALYSLFDPSISRGVFQVYNFATGQQQEPPIQLWQGFVLAYGVLLVLAIYISIRKIRPNLKRRKK
jgi:hypothetical protein